MNLAHTKQGNSLRKQLVDEVYEVYQSCYGIRMHIQCLLDALMLSMKRWARFPRSWTGYASPLYSYTSNAPCPSASHSIQSIQRAYSIQLYRLYTIQRYTLPLWQNANQPVKRIRRRTTPARRTLSMTMDIRPVSCASSLLIELLDCESRFRRRCGGETCSPH